MEPTKTTPDLSATHFLCERCGGMGTQEAGLWNPDTNRYDDVAGTCRSCGGSGYLGPLPPRSGGPLAEALLISVPSVESVPSVARQQPVSSPDSQTIPGEVAGSRRELPEVAPAGE